MFMTVNSHRRYTQAPPKPILPTGTQWLRAQLGRDWGAARTVPYDGWYLAFAEWNVPTKIAKLYVNDQSSIDHVSTDFAGVQHTDISLGNSMYASTGYVNAIGEQWGAGVANGALTDAERAVLYNNGNGITFADLAASSNPAAISLWAKIIYAWQLNDSAAASFPDAKGHKALTKTGTVTAVNDPKFGWVTRFTNGRLQAVGSEAQGLENRTQSTYFTWVRPRNTHQAQLIGRYDGSFAVNTQVLFGGTT